MANLIVLNPQRGDSVAISAISNGYSQTNAQFGTTGFATVTGVFPGGAANGLIQRAITISGFANAKNNGTFQIVSSTATQLTINNPFAVAVTAVASGSYQTQGTPAQYASKIENIWSNQNGDNATVNANAGDTLVAIAIGLRQIVNFDQLHGTAPYYPQFGDNAGTIGDYPSGGFPFGWLQSLNDSNVGAAPVISDQANGAGADIIASAGSGTVITITMENIGQSAFSTGQHVLLTGLQPYPGTDTPNAANGTTVVVLAGATATVFTANAVTAVYTNSAHETGHAQPAGNTWALKAFASIVDSDYTVAYPFSGPLADGTVTPAVWNGQLGKTSSGGLYAYGSNLYTSLTPSDAYQSAKWNLDGYYPSIYIWTASAVSAGSYKVELNSMFQSGDTQSPFEWSQGSDPVFDGGVNFQVYCISGANATVVESISTTDTIANPATAPATLTITAADGGALISVGLMKSNNVFAAGTTGGTPVSLVLSKVTPLAYGQPQFAKEVIGAVYNGTITGGANNAFVGYTFMVAGFVNASNNGTFVCTASSATQLTLTNGSAIAESHAATAAYTAPMSQIGNGLLVGGSQARYLVEFGAVVTGTYNPGFNNPLGYSMLVGSIGLNSN